jgi:predicted ATPase
MITSIHLKNYKSIRETQLELGKLNILIGQNGSGKSNFLSFFHLLTEGANERLNTEINLQGGFGELIHYSATAQDYLEWNLTFNGFFDIERIYYTGKLMRRGATAYAIHLEEIARDPFPDDPQRPYKYLHHSAGYGRMLTADEQSYLDTSINDLKLSQELSITQIRDRQRYPISTELRRQIAE